MSENLKKLNKKLGITLVLFILIAPLGLLTTSSQWGEWTLGEMQQAAGIAGTSGIASGIASGAKESKEDLGFQAIFQDYMIPKLGSVASLIISIALTFLILYALLWGIYYLTKKKSPKD